MPHPENITGPSAKSLKSRELIDFVRGEIEGFRTGNLSKISTLDQLKTRFGYSPLSGQVHFHLKQAGLTQERKTLQKEIRPTPTTEWAWMLGILAGGGRVSKNGSICITNSEKELRDVVKSRGERLFDKSAQTLPLYGQMKSPTLIFNSIRYARGLGNFVYDEWVTTILDQHSWVLRDNKYAWAFLEGVFETVGHVRKMGQKRFENIIISTSYKKSANFLAELLVRVGVKNPIINTNRNSRDGVDGVSMVRLEDVKYFSQHIHSVIPGLEERLSFYRNFNIEQYTRRQFRERVVRDQESAMREWNKLVAILGHSPSKKEIRSLKGLGLTMYEPGVYIRRFGKTESQTSFVIARDVLIRESKGKVFEFDNDRILQARTTYEASRSHIKHRKLKDEDIAEEWTRITNLLGHTPTSFDIQHMRIKDETAFCLKTYVQRFGNGSFKNAVEALNKMAGLDFAPKSNVVKDSKPSDF